MKKEFAYIEENIYEILEFLDTKLVTFTKKVNSND
jgi:hypothetical protein